MSLRLWLNISAVLGMSILVSYMVSKEVLESKTSGPEVTYVDRLVKLELRYIKKDREENFKNFGMSEDMIAHAKKRLKRYDKQKKKVLQFLKDAVDEDKEGIERAFCMKSPLERPRYWAVQYLMEKDGSKPPSSVALKRISSIQKQGWSEALPIDFIYRTLELRSDPKSDSTIMYLGAVFTENTDDVRNRNSPWGDGSNWSWSQFVKANKGMENKIADYVALMHLFAEVANDPSKGICFSE